METKHPNRKKDKLNPYTLSIQGDRYYLTFKDGQGVLYELEIQRALYELFNTFELEDISHINKVQRHYDASELTDQLIYKADYRTEALEDTVIKHIECEELHEAIEKLPTLQRRRLILYYFCNLTYGTIAEMEGCTITPVKRAIDLAVNKLKKIIENSKKTF